jgi:predicted O-methyltransferase YrrM
MQYELSHLVQDPTQAVFGPIQDDEALLLFAVCRVTCATRIAEFGGQSGYSARNFLVAISHAPNGKVYTVDCNPVPILSSSHQFIHKSAKDVAPGDFDDQPLDLVFFDCHDYRQQLEALHTLLRGGIILRGTIIALHDTGTHPTKLLPWSFRGDGGYIHRTEERALVNDLQDLGYECVSFHAPQPLPPLQFRHGLTLCRSKHRLINQSFEGG